MPHINVTHIVSTNEALDTSYLVLSKFQCNISGGIGRAQEVCGESREGSGRFVSSQHTEPSRLTQSFILGNCCTCLLHEFKIPSFLDL